MRAWLLILLCCVGCRTSAPVLVAEQLGESGWYEIQGPYSAKPFFKRSRSESERLDVAGASCEELLPSRDGAHQVFVLVPGIQGAGREWEPVILQLMRPGRSLFFYRWVPVDQLAPLTRGLASGLGTLARCLDQEGDELVVLAHSAGGIIASHAASRVRAREGAPPTVRVFTAASALAGIQVRGDGEEEDEEEEDETAEEVRERAEQEEEFVMEMGGAFRDYPPAGTGVEVFHLRTQAPADPVMRPIFKGKLPNDPRVGVPGAYMVDLPDHLGHDPSLFYAAQRLEDGGWEKWRKSPRVQPPASPRTARQ